MAGTIAKEFSMNDALRRALKRLHHPLEVMPTCVRRYVAYPLSLRRIKVILHERGIKRIIRPMPGFKSIRSAAGILAGIETMSMIKRGQFDCRDRQVACAADRFYSLVARTADTTRFLSR